MTNEINVAFASDNNYSEPLAVSIYSLLDNLSKDCFANIYILDGGISEDNKKKISDINFDNFKIEFITIDPQLFSEYPLLNNGQQTIATYYRLKLPSLFPDLSKIMYLDCDIVVNIDLSEVYKTNLGGYLVAAVEEPYNINYKRLPSFGMKQDTPYFNAGVGIFNLDKMREFDLEKKCYEHMLKYKQHLKYQDQDLLNAVCEDKWLPLSPIYNSLIYFFELRFMFKYYNYDIFKVFSARKKSILIHYNRHPKPWKKECADPRLYMYKKYLSKTSFARNDCKVTVADFIKYQLSCFYINLYTKYNDIVLFLKNNFPFLYEKAKIVKNKIFG
jgi:lipopolysaccharide biosynthesis glycosyltransferase